MAAKNPRPENRRRMLPFGGFPAAVPGDGLGVPEEWGCWETIDDIKVTGGHGCRAAR
jgi:hypothetical protein